MTRYEIVKLAKLCELGRVCGPLDYLLDDEWEDLHRFAQLAIDTELKNLTTPDISTVASQGEIMKENKEIKATHTYAEILRAIADGEDIQFNGGCGWSDKDHYYVLTEICGESFDPENYRIKPKTIRIGNYDVPEPLRVAPKKGQNYWVVAINDQNLSHLSTWTDDGTDNRRLERGLIHLDNQSAELHGKAIVSLTQIGD